AVLETAPAVDEAAPVLEPVPVVLEAAPVVNAAAPVLEPAPVVLEAIPVAPTVEPAPVFAFEPVSAPAPAAQVVSDEEADAGTAFKVVLRLSNGERIDAHTCNGATAARRHAEELVRGLAAGPERWPYFSGRFVRPESIISVD